MKTVRNHLGRDDVIISDAGFGQATLRSRTEEFIMTLSTEKMRQKMNETAKL